MAQLMPVMTFACFGDDRKDWTSATAGGVCQAQPADLRDKHLTNWTLGEHDVDGTGLTHTDPGTGWRGPDGIWRLVVGNQLAPNVGAFRTWESPDFGRTTKCAHKYSAFAWCLRVSFDRLLAFAASRCRKAIRFILLRGSAA